MLTPFTVLSLIYSFLIPLNNIWAHKKYSFELITDQTILKLLYCLLIVFSSSIFLTILCYRRENNNIVTANDYKNSIKKQANLIIKLFYLGIVSKYISMLLAISKYGILNIKGKDGGIFAHIGNLSVIFLPLLLVVYKENGREKRIIFPFSLLFINLLIFGGKYVILINFTYLLLVYSYIYKISLVKKIKTVVILFLVHY